jgi:hypothetical protein
VWMPSLLQSPSSEKRFGNVAMRRKVRYQRRFDPATHSVAQTVRSYTSVIAAERQRQQLLVALRQLPFDTQVMLELHYWENLPIIGIAEVVELPINTVKTRLRRSPATCNVAFGCHPSRCRSSHELTSASSMGDRSPTAA